MKTINTILLSLSFVFSMSLNFSYGQEGYVPIEDVKKAAVYYASQKWGDVEIFDYREIYEIGSDYISSYSFCVWKKNGIKYSLDELKIKAMAEFNVYQENSNRYRVAKISQNKSEILNSLTLKDRSDSLRLKASEFGTIVIGAKYSVPLFWERRNGLPDYLLKEAEIDVKFNNYLSEDRFIKRVYYLSPGNYGYDVTDESGKIIFYNELMGVLNLSGARLNKLNIKNQSPFEDSIYNSKWEKLSDISIENIQEYDFPEALSEIINGVPYYSQDDYGINTCGPTAAAQVLGYWDDNGYNNLIDYGSSSRYENFEGTEYLVENLKTAMNWTSGGGVNDLFVASGLQNVTNSSQYSNNLNFNADYDIISLWSTVIVPSVDNDRPFMFGINEEFQEPDGTTHNWAHWMTGVGYRIEPDMRILIVHKNDGVGWNEDFEINYETINSIVPPAATVEVFPGGQDNINPNCQVISPNGGNTYTFSSIQVKSNASDISGIWQVQFQYSQDHSNWLPFPGGDILDASGPLSSFDKIFFADQAGITFDQTVWVRARSRDNWSNWSSWDESDQSFTIDLRGPLPTSLSVSATLNPTSVQQNDPVIVSGSAIYNTGNPVTSGTVLIEISGINTWTTYLNSSGNFSTIINAPSSTGNYTVKVTVADGTISNFVNKSLSVTGGSSGSGYTYNRSTICENVNPNSPYAPINETHWIRADEVYVFCWTELDNIASGKNLRVKWNWYRPDGSSLGSIESDYTGNGPWDWYRMWGGWTVQGTTLANTEGKWTVKIYVKEFGGSYIYRETQYFTVRYNLTEHRMAEDVGPDPYPTINPKNIFYQTDSKALTWMNLDDVSDCQEIKWEFHEPNGNMYGTGATYSVPDPGHGTYYPWYRLWGWIDINNNQATDKTGNWYVDVFIKNAFNSWELKYTDNFTIKENPNVNPVVTIGNPSTVMEGQTITISVSVNDNAYLKKVIFYWNDGTDHNVVLADNINSSSYNGNASIGPFVENKQISCYVLAIDNSVNQATSLQKEFTIEDTDITGPTISNFSILEYNGNGNGQIDPNEQVNISWNLSDPSGIGSVVLIVDSTSQTIVNTTHSICGPFSEGSHSVVLFASDNDISPMSSSYYSSFNVSQQAFSLGGFVSYDNSAVTGLNGVNVNLIQNGNIVGSAITNLSGTYTFNNVVNGSYSINSSTSKLWGGVNSTDALQIRRHIAGISLLSGLKLLAADVNASSTVTSTDALLIRRRVAGLDSTFASGDWLFENPAFNVSGQNVIQNFKGLCFGDVNGSYVPSMMMGKESFVNSSGNSEIYLKNNEVLSVPIKTLSPLNISALTLVIKYPSESIEIESVSSKLEGLLYNIQDEEIRIAWDDLSSVNFKPDEAIITLSVKNKNQTLKEGEISFTLDASSELADVQANVIKDVQLDIPQIKINYPEEFTLLDCYPNPFNPSTMIEYKLPENSVVRLEIVNIIGERIGLLIDGTQEAGTHRLQWDASELPSGVYIYRLEARGERNSFSKVKKMLLVK